MLTVEDAKALLNDAIQLEPMMFMFPDESGVYISPETDELRVRAVDYFIERDIEYDLNTVIFGILTHASLSELSPRVQNILQAVF